MNKNLNVKRNVIYFLSDMKHQFPKFSPYRCLAITILFITIVRPWP